MILEELQGPTELDSQERWDPMETRQWQRT